MKRRNAGGAWVAVAGIAALMVGCGQARDTRFTFGGAGVDVTVKAYDAADGRRLYSVVARYGGEADPGRASPRSEPPEGAARAAGCHGRETHVAFAVGGGVPPVLRVRDVRAACRV